MRVVVAACLRNSDYASLDGRELRRPAIPSLAPTAAVFHERRRRVHAGPQNRTRSRVGRIVNAIRQPASEANSTGRSGVHAQIRVSPRSDR
jgi:hypothetical protein